MTLTLKVETICLHTHLPMMMYHHTKFGPKRFSSSVSHNTELLSNVLLHYCRYFGIKDFVAKKSELNPGLCSDTERLTTKSTSEYNQTPTCLINRLVRIQVVPQTKHLPGSDVVYRCTG